MQYHGTRTTSRQLKQNSVVAYLRKSSSNPSFFDYRHHLQNSVLSLSLIELLFSTDPLTKVIVVPVIVTTEIVSSSKPKYLERGLTNVLGCKLHHEASSALSRIFCGRSSIVSNSQQYTKWLPTKSQVMIETRRTHSSSFNATCTIAPCWT